MKAQTIGKLKSYAKSQFLTPAGTKYKVDYEHTFQVFLISRAITLLIYV